MRHGKAFCQNTVNGNSYGTVFSISVLVDIVDEASNLDFEA